MRGGNLLWSGIVRLATGLDVFLSSFSTSRRCSLNYSLIIIIFNYSCVTNNINVLSLTSNLVIFDLMWKMLQLCNV